MLGCCLISSITKSTAVASAYKNRAWQENQLKDEQLESRVWGFLRLFLQFTKFLAIKVVSIHTCSNREC